MNLAKFLRAQIGQISYSCKARSSFPKIWQQIKAIKYINFEELPPISKTKDEVWAISVVKNEIDILPASIEHLLRQGIDRIIILDNLSTDGTSQYLHEISAQNPNIFVGTDSNPAHQQSEKMTYLATLAWSRGAKWIIPFDADEFWYAPQRTLKEFFNSCNHDVVYAGFHHTVPVLADPENITESELVMDAAYSFPAKVAFRSHPLAVIIPGNHEVNRIGARTLGLEIVHVQYRGPQQIAKKVRQGTESSRLTGEELDWFSPHWVAGSLLSDAELESVWAKISHGEPEQRIKFAAEGPMIRGRFLQWMSWDEHSEFSDLWKDKK
ncbi:glycosyltransferase family 2 protein [Rothia terrae]|uniref:glycosyltransferase family 2 protein n=1 Tax=Rothia terrae TaxID=396015 RepID=UPI00288217A4|nr:glycosyltransferase family 2 protein [Rothia terrae]MDT0190353.1 glycosyltransferase family 2 protein [Rothia terrae]